MESTQKAVQDYYGKVLQTKNDLKTTACCAAESLPEYIRPIVSQIEPEIIARFYGCGVPVPSAVEGCHVLDLGSGTGRDVYVFSKLVGERGLVTGVDMTEEQIAVARKYLPVQMERFGYKKPNVNLVQGYIEDLASADIADNSVDLVVSNCVINLSPDKQKVFSEIFRVLKPGGELFFSDVFVDRRLPKPVQEDPVILGECLGGAMYWEDFRRMMMKVGCMDSRVVSSSPIDVTNKEIANKIGPARFTSLTVRAFKLDLEDRCEDYGQVAFYRGGIPESPNSFTLDDHHFFEKDRPMLVCSNTAAMISQTRFAKYFEVVGDTSTHYGLFDCGPTPGASSGSDVAVGSCC